MRQVVRAVYLAIGLLASGPVAAQDPVTDLAAALDLPAVFEIMREEGVTSSEELASEAFGSRGSARWQAETARIYDAGRWMTAFMPALEDALKGQDLAVTQAFFDSETGRRIITLEISARRAMLDEGVEEAADLALEEAIAADLPRLKQLYDLIEAGDLLESNVTGALNYSLSYARGMMDAGGEGMAVDEQEILAQIWEQEDAIRTETKQWLLSYLLLAYQPLSDDELADYIAFTASPDGKQLSKALFQAFDLVFSRVSYDLGAALAREMTGEQL